MTAREDAKHLTPTEHTPTQTTEYTSQELGELAVGSARLHSDLHGGGRVFGVRWSLVLGDGRTVLHVQYACNRPKNADGVKHCGLYYTTFVL